MLKILSIAAGLLAAYRAARLARRDGNDANLWRRDPLSHPALLAMSRTELADLPICHPMLREPTAC